MGGREVLGGAKQMNPEKFPSGRQGRENCIFFFFNLKTIATLVWKFFYVHLFSFLALLE
jgi:hypothetical protein